MWRPVLFVGTPHSKTGRLVTLTMKYDLQVVF
jgi:hypothetical protein